MYPKASHDRLEDFLINQGYLQKDVSYDAALKAFLERHELLEDDCIIAREIDSPRFCSTPDRVGQGCAWDGKERPLPLTWATKGTLPGLSEEVMRRVYSAAWASWAAVCGIAPQYVPTNTRSVNVRMGHAHIDGPSGTLAWSYLPCGPDKELEQRYDTGDSWFFELGRPTGGRISLVAVAAHEIGHAIGLEHLARGNLLAPYYTPDIRKPQSGDIAEAQLRYGPPITKPDDPGEEPGDWDVEMVFKKNGEVDFELTGSLSRG